MAFKSLVLVVASAAVVHGGTIASSQAAQSSSISSVPTITDRPSQSLPSVTAVHSMHSDKKHSTMKPKPLWAYGAWNSSMGAWKHPHASGSAVSDYGFHGPRPSGHTSWNGTKHHDDKDDNDDDDNGKNWPKHGGQHGRHMNTASDCNNATTSRTAPPTSALWSVPAVSPSVEASSIVPPPSSASAVSGDTPTTGVVNSSSSIPAAAASFVSDVNAAPSAPASSDIVRATVSTLSVAASAVSDISPSGLPSVASSDNGIVPAPTPPPPVACNCVDSSYSSTGLLATSSTTTLTSIITMTKTVIVTVNSLPYLSTSVVDQEQHKTHKFKPPRASSDSSVVPWESFTALPMQSSLLPNSIETSHPATSASEISPTPSAPSTSPSVLISSMGQVPPQSVPSAAMSSMGTSDQPSSMVSQTLPSTTSSLAVPASSSSLVQSMSWGNGSVSWNRTKSPPSRFGTATRPGRIAPTTWIKSKLDRNATKPILRTPKTLILNNFTANAVLAVIWVRPAQSIRGQAEYEFHTMNTSHFVNLDQCDGTQQQPPIWKVDDPHTNSAESHNSTGVAGLVGRPMAGDLGVVKGFKPKNMAECKYVEDVPHVARLECIAGSGGKKKREIISCSPPFLGPFPQLANLTTPTKGLCGLPGPEHDVRDLVMYCPYTP